MIREGTFASFYMTGSESLVSGDRRTTIMPLIMAGDFDDATTNQPEILEIVERVNAESAFEVFLTGQATVGNDFEDVGQDDLLRGETFGIPIALLILILVFGTLVAAFVPVVNPLRVPITTPFKERLRASIEKLCNSDTPLPKWPEALSLHPDLSERTN